MTGYLPPPPEGGPDREYLLDVAVAATRDSWPLVGDSDLVEAICADYGRLAADYALATDQRTSLEAELARERASHDETAAQLARVLRDALAQAATQTQALAQGEMLRIAALAEAQRLRELSIQLSNEMVITHHAMATLAFACHARRAAVVEVRREPLIAIAAIRADGSH